MTKLGLILNEAKTSLNDARKERFEFLGYSFGPQYPYKSKVRMCLGASPSKKSVQRLRTKVGELLVPSNTAPWPDVRDPLNRILRGWSNYFCYGARAAAYRNADHSVRERVRDFLARRHKLAGRSNRRFRDGSWLLARCNVGGQFHLMAPTIEKAVCNTVTSRHLGYVPARHRHRGHQSPLVVVRPHAPRNERREILRSLMSRRRHGRISNDD